MIKRETSRVMKSVMQYHMCEVHDLNCHQLFKDGVLPVGVEEMKNRYNSVVQVMYALHIQ
jgi:hypothetical protein